MAPAFANGADDRIVIAVDFGSSFSGVAYAFNVPGKKADVVSVMDWPGKLLPMIPSTLVKLEFIPWGSSRGGHLAGRFHTDLSLSPSMRLLSGMTDGFVTL